MPTALQFAVQIARQAGNLLADYFVPFGVAADSKSDNTLVTQADLTADKWIAEAIQNKFPNDQILSEEGNTHYKNQNQPVWVIDPLDGTTNFSLGLPIWGVSIARIVDGMPQTAVVHYPLLRETYCAEYGKGATMNQMPLASLSVTHDKTSFFACCSRTFRYYKVDLPYKTRILGAATYSLSCVSRNSAIMAMEVTPKIWDLSASWLIVKESGKRIDVLEGTPPFPLQSNLDYKMLSFPLIAARDDNAFQDLKNAIQKKLA